MCKVLPIPGVGCKSGAFGSLSLVTPPHSSLSVPGLESPAQETLPDKEEAAGLRELGDTVSGHLAEMLQQLSAVNAAKPSERVAVRQGESGAAHGPCGVHRLWEMSPNKLLSSCRRS